MGWDNNNKISILNEHIKTFNSNDPLKDHIKKPPSRKVRILLFKISFNKNLYLLLFAPILRLLLLFFITLNSSKLLR